MGQLEICQLLNESVTNQLAGKPADKIFKIESGHGPGKSFLCGALVNWFIDCFDPCGITTTAPSEDQLKLLLWKDIRNHRANHKYDPDGGLKPSAPEMWRHATRYAIGRVVRDDHGKGTQKAHGQHLKHMMFVFEESEGIPDFQYDATDAMFTGPRVIIWLAIGNPASRSSGFARLGKRSDVVNVRLDMLNYPNVVHDDPNLIPGGTRREWVDNRIDRWCTPVSAHNPDVFTFTVPWRTRNGKPIIYEPIDPDFLWRVRGIAPTNTANNTFVPLGRYEAARIRKRPLAGSRVFQLGLDAARYGGDKGALYGLLNGVMKKYASIAQEDGKAYADAVALAAQEERGNFNSISLRADGTGGYASGGVDLLRHADQYASFRKHEHVIHEVQFGSNAKDESKYKLKVTELYAESAETINGIVIACHTQELEEDLTDRKFRYVNNKGIMVKILEDKDAFKKDHKSAQYPQGRSPDDGDGFVLAAAPEYLFQKLKRKRRTPSRSQKGVVF